MTEPTARNLCDLAALQDLLRLVDRDPISLAKELQAEREACVKDERLQRHLDRGELGYLQQQAGRRTGPLADAVAGAASAARDFMFRSLIATDEGHPSVLFELVELKVALLSAGKNDSAAEVEAVLATRLEAIEPSSDLEEEARERFAVLATEGEDLDLPSRISLLMATGDLLQELWRRTGSVALRRLGRRLHRLADDRHLAGRLEALLTRRGVVALETTSLLLLLLVFTLLTVQLAVDLEASTQRRLLLVDGFACLFFLAEFALKLTLARNRGSWFVRNALTDLLPAMPAALLLFDAPLAAEAGDAVVVRIARLFRITYFARYIHALRPLISVLRLLLFLVRGLDSLVRRLRPLLNRNFVFFEREVTARPLSEPPEQVNTVFMALQREHGLLAALPEPERTEQLLARAHRLRQRLVAAPIDGDRMPLLPSGREDVPVERVIEVLHELTPSQLAWAMQRRDLEALDRVVRVLSSPVVRWLPFVRQIALARRPATAEERVVAAGRRLATWLEAWRERILWYADLHGILTGPQILDRVATAMIRATQRPAVRLLMFGAAFLVVRGLMGEGAFLGEFLRRFVATPLLLFGSFCMVFLLLGRWLKKLAGEASETLKRTSEAQFITLLELAKVRHEATDLRFLARRMFRFETDAETGSALLKRQLDRLRGSAEHLVRRGQVRDREGTPSVHDGVLEDVHRVALMYQHFLGGAILHENDVKTSEQLLANLSLENIRCEHLVYTRRDRRRLRKLSLDRGSLFSGPYLWFQFITESVALETAKRIIDYNRHCVPLAQRAFVPESVVEAFRHWKQRKASYLGGRTFEKKPGIGKDGSFATTEFNALDFLAPDDERDEYLTRIHGGEVVDLLRRDRRAMIREIFGTRPMHRVARSRRTLNLFALYERRFSRGRILLLPVVTLGGFVMTFGMMIKRTADIVREILDPAGAEQRRVRGQASFAVALRKIHRMKAPGLMEAIRMRVAFDPAYCGVPATWSHAETIEERPEVERDLDFLQVKDRERVAIRAQVEQRRAQVLEWHSLRRELPAFPRLQNPIDDRQGERAVTIAYATDTRHVRTLLRAEQWLVRVRAMVEDPQTRLPSRWLARTVSWCFRLGATHPVDRWLTGQGIHGFTARGRSRLRAMWSLDVLGFRRMVHAWSMLPSGASPRAVALEELQRVHNNHHAISRELAALRAVQTLSVLDVRNYRSLVFRLGGYEADGEDPALAEALP